MGEIFRVVYHDSIMCGSRRSLRHKLVQLPKLQRLAPPGKLGASKRTGDKGGDKEKTPLKRRRTDGATKLKPCHQFKSAGKCK